MRDLYGYENIPQFKKKKKLSNASLPGKKQLA